MTLWNPVASAGSGATFAGVLAALVVAASIQIAFGPQGQGLSKPHRLRSLAWAAPTLVTLLAATYVYIVLDGVPSSQSELVDAYLLTPEARDNNCWAEFNGIDLPRPEGENTSPTVADSTMQRAQRDLPGADQSLANPSLLADCAAGLERLSATGLSAAAGAFAIAGSLLALGAFLSLFIVVMSIHENAPSKDPLRSRDWGAAVLLVAQYVIGIVLYFGYLTGYRIASSANPDPYNLTLIVCILCTAFASRGSYFAMRGTTPSHNKPIRGSTFWYSAAVLALAGFPLILVVLLVSSTSLQDFPVTSFGAFEIVHYTIASQAAVSTLLRARKAESRSEVGHTSTEVGEDGGDESECTPSSTAPSQESQQQSTEAINEHVPGPIASRVDAFAEKLPGDRTPLQDRLRLATGRPREDADSSKTGSPDPEPGSGQTGRTTDV